MFIHFLYLCGMDKKSTILNTVLKLVNKEGFYHLSMKNVAKEAGIAAGTTYLYFNSKEELINELYKQIAQEYRDSIINSYKEENSIEENFFEMAGKALSYYVENPDRFSFIQQYTYSPFIFKETQEENFAILEPLQKFLVQAKKEKKVKDLPDLMLVSLVSGPINSMMKMFLAGKTDLTKKSTQKKLLEACWQSITI